MLKENQNYETRNLKLIFLLFLVVLLLIARYYFEHSYLINDKQFDVGIIESVNGFHVTNKTFAHSNLRDFSSSTVNNNAELNPLSWEDVDISWKLELDSPRKYFVYQPSGGWGNQRIILQNAIAAANAMNRILVLPPIAPHNFLYHGYNHFNSSDMISMAHILDIKLLSKVVKPGLRVWNKTLSELELFWKQKSWKVYSKPRKIDGKKLTFNSEYIKKNWGDESKHKDFDVVFWNKDGVWLCCGPSTLYGANIVFNSHLQSIAKKLVLSIDEKLDFNSVHIRRGGGHTGSDRRTAKTYFEEHMTRFNPDTTLYIATDEANKKWFLPFMTEFKFKRVLFFEDLVERNRPYIDSELNRYPFAMRNDVMGFIEQLICASAKMFEGSNGSTFTLAINSLRKNLSRKGKEL